LAAAFAVKMGVGHVMMIGGETIIECPAAGADPIYNAVIHQ
jgi:hypothetical protein